MKNWENYQKVIKLNDVCLKLKILCYHRLSIVETNEKLLKLDAKVDAEQYRQKTSYSSQKLTGYFFQMPLQIIRTTSSKHSERFWMISLWIISDYLWCFVNSRKLIFDLLICLANMGNASMGVVSWTIS